ncbi:Terpene synthase [Thalictrum thalictroides]|uniref:Terpene synthase n=1 Tax=Thalictrum thalictroides TaxID=46969 RepID=A0A7J6VVQ1_THATH|nr:Terpene synthase [Thalictrum thalictroides]
MENDNNYCADLYNTSLRFRLLRQHHYPVDPDVFNKFKDRNGRFMEGMNKDVKGLLSLYEASHLSVNGEDVLEEALKYTTTCLKSIESHFDIILAKQVQHALAIPLHWRMPRIEARNFIDVYDRDDKKHAVLLQLAKLDFNLVQSIHQRNLSDLSWWWSDLGFKEKLTFSRDRLVENFIWAMGIAHEPQYSKCREGLTKFICILTAIDDVYDIYGSLDELELFTEAVCRWDISATEGLPPYMKTSYLAMLNLVNIISNNIKRDHGIDVSRHIVEEWKNLCKSYLKEARWFYNGYTPTLEEYLGNGWTSVGGPAAMVHAYFLHAENISVESLHCLKHGSELMYWASIITRLVDDLGNAKDEIIRGDVPKSIQCYMKQTGVSEEQARQHVKGLVRSYWKKLNEESVKSILPKSMIEMIINMVRTAQCIFEHGDGIGTSHGTTKDTAISLFVEPISIKRT